MIDPERQDAALLRLLLRCSDVAERNKGGADLRAFRLSAEELRTLQALSYGVGSQGAADLTGYTLEGVKSHTKQARRILGAKNTTHACCQAVRLGLIR